MGNIGPEHIHYLAKIKNRVEARLNKVQERTQTITKSVVRTLEVAAAAGIGGVIQGHAGEEGSHVFHIPTDLGLGILLNGLGLFNAAGSYSEHLNNMGDGFLASFTSSIGFGWGDAWQKTGKFSFHSLPHGGGPELPAGGAPTHASGELGAAQMADIVARVRAAAQHG